MYFCFMNPKFLLIFFLFFTFQSHSQLSQWGFEAKPKIGFLMAHRGVMGHLPREHALGGEIAWFFHSSGKKEWHHAYRFPRAGVALYGSTVGNRELLGSYFGAYSFVEFPFVKREKSEFTGKIGAGLGYGTKVFDQELNPKNVAMSTHINALISLGLQYRRFFGDYHTVIGVDLTHFSNGSTKVPNLGINLPYFSLGLGKTIHKSPADSLELWKKIGLNQAIKHRWDFSINAIASVKEVYPTGRRKFPIYAISMLGNKQFGPKSGIELALDLIYKTSIEVYKQDIYPEKKKSDIVQAGVYVGYVLPLDRLRFVLGMGAYVRDVYNPDDLFYHRIGMRYRASEHWNVQLVLKSHWAKADYVEYGIGYVF